MEQIDEEQLEKEEAMERILSSFRIAAIKRSKENRVENLLKRMKFKNGRTL